MYSMFAYADSCLAHIVLPDALNMIRNDFVINVLNETVLDADFMGEMRIRAAVP